MRMCVENVTTIMNQVHKQKPMEKSKLHTIKSGGVSQISSAGLFWQFAINCVVEFHDYGVEDTEHVFRPQVTCHNIGRCIECSMRSGVVIPQCEPQT